MVGSSNMVDMVDVVSHLRNGRCPVIIVVLVSGRAVDEVGVHIHHNDTAIDFLQEIIINEKHSENLAISTFVTFDV